MPKVVVEMPDFETAILTAIQTQFVDAALEVAKEVPSLIKQEVMLNNRDIDGNSMPDKKPRPKGSPTNNPGVPCVDSGNMLDNSRWVIEQVSESEVDVIYSPPEYLQYLIEKAPEAGGRKWITPDKINDDVRALIEEKIAVALRTGDANEPSGFGKQAYPEGFGP